MFFNNNYIFIAIKNALLKLFISLECKYNKLHFGIRISSIEVSQQKLASLHIAPCLHQNLQKEIHPGTTLSQERRNSDSECFSINIIVCTAFPRRRASRKSRSCKSRFLTELRTSQPLLFPPPPPPIFVRMTVQSKEVFIAFLNDRVISPRHV